MYFTNCVAEAVVLLFKFFKLYIAFMLKIELRIKHVFAAFKTLFRFIILINGYHIFCSLEHFFVLNVIIIERLEKLKSITLVYLDHSRVLQIKLQK